MADFPSHSGFPSAPTSAFRSARMPPSWSSIIACALSSSSARNANTAFPPMHATYVFIEEFLLGGKRRLGAGVSHALRKCHELLVRQVKSLPELRTVDRSAKHGSEPFGCLLYTSDAADE